MALHSGIGFSKILDDILPKLMTSTGSFEDLFRKEIAKYDHICEDIAHNIDAKEQLLMQIQKVLGNTMDPIVLDRREIY
ncbi:hypothetical protein G4B88_014188 [Cannabis sativa]|uniref:ALIX V-shaped domain-containing protein n=1 Tax=Cannabis sativa TaxID=3483 RepID=A0A7J6I192_CANSA|nr:hypothetical protein G4B88_014188 [Cannabis sativa]